MPVLCCPVGNKCNLKCVYCYEEAQRNENDREELNYNQEIILPMLKKQKRPVSLFGGEPLLTPIEGLEEIFKIGFEKHGCSHIQTNGTLITEEHIRLFQKYNVQVGFSIDGPDRLNGLRWAGSEEKTLEMTKITQANIRRLCKEGVQARLIVTLHKKNASKEVMPQLKAWFLSLYDIGVRYVRLHLLQSNSDKIKEKYALSPKEAIEALFELETMESILGITFFDIFYEVRQMLASTDYNVSCTWRGCDIYNTPSVDIIDADGKVTNCGRSKRDDMTYSKTQGNSFERCILLYHTQQKEGGCKDCRFFLACKGHCPGMAIDGDWRNRSEYCEVWKALFTYFESKMLEQGKYPVSILMNRKKAEKRMLEAWHQGKNPTLESVIRESMFKNPQIKEYDELPELFRVAWANEESKQIWEERLERIRDALPKMMDGINSTNTIKDEEEIAWLEELRSSMIRCSTLHGISELVTPMFKASFNSKGLVK